MFRLGMEALSRFMYYLIFIRRLVSLIFIISWRINFGMIERREIGASKYNYIRGNYMSKNGY